MTGRDNELWQQSWRDRQTDFHQKATNAHLVRFWSTLGVAPGERIFVPLCGKSLDLLWLAGQGHSVVGVELSPLAARAFFRENRMQPRRRPCGQFTLWEHGRISILCGDFFALTAADLGEIAAVFDRAALTALPDDLRAPYLAHLRRIVPAACKIMLLTTEEPEAWETADQPFAVAEEITTLYSDAFNIELHHVESAFEADPDPSVAEEIRVERKVYLLTPKPAAGSGLPAPSGRPAQADHQTGAAEPG
ncbi:MAG: thiopurine S-methyltransferase [Proteobacteria bacterium]|nr:thiopurine S-methyltransferase [Pseudomonadota bacterium]